MIIIEEELPSIFYSLSILENLSHADISPLCCQDNCKYKHTEHSYPYSLHLLASCHNAGIGANVKRHSDIKKLLVNGFQNVQG